jgi:hypothetical protein
VNKPVGSIVSGSKRDVLAIGARRGNGRASEFNTDAVVARGGVVAFVVQPDEIGYPRGVGVTRHDDVVADAVVVEMGQSAVAVGLVAVPGVVVEGVGVAVGGRLVDAGEDGLRAD